MEVPVENPLAQGLAALRAGDAAGARRALDRAYAESPSGAAIEGLARAAYLELDFTQAIEVSEHAYSVFRDAGDHVGAVRVARSLAYLYGSIVGDGAVMAGWLARAQTLLGEETATAEGGWVALNAGMFEADRVRKDQRLREALEVARRFRDTELEVASLSYLGASLVHADRTDEGMALLDEALAAVAGREIDDFFVLQEVFCQLFSACEQAHDVARADQWIRVGEAIAKRRNLPAVSAFCSTHYGGVLTAAGRWPEADVALTDAVRLWSLGHRSMRGGALIRLAQLRARQGRFEEAERLLDGLDLEAGAAWPLATVYLARGETSRARDILERALNQADPEGGTAAPLLALLVDVHLVVGAFDDAHATVDQLARCATAHGSPYLKATAALARGLVGLAAGTGDPQADFREASAGFGRAEMPMELARSRLALANALLTERPEVATAEARAALDTFERLEAAHDADAAAAVLRSLGVRSTARHRVDGVLTKRESEVLVLLGHGLSNPEISDRLYISRKTVEHHVARLLAKLGVRSRAEAAAFATQSKRGAI